MKKTMKKTLLLLVAAGFLLTAVVACGGSSVAPEVPPVAEPVPLPDVIDNDADLIVDEGSDTNFDDIEIVLPGEGEDFNADTTVAAYFSVRGKVVSIEEADGFIRVEIEDTDGNPAYLIIDENTVFPFSKEFNVGDEVTGWYLTDRPMIMIWPPEYNISVLVAGAPDSANIKVDRFHAWDLNRELHYISQDEMFAFSLDENTEVILANGDDFTDGEIEGRRIVVIYGISTRGIPEMAVAEKLIVLYEDIVPLS